MKVMEDHGEASRASQEFELRRQIAPRAIERYVVARAVAAAILEGDHVGMRLADSCIRFAELRPFRVLDSETATGPISEIERIPNVLWGPVDTVAVRLVKHGGRVIPLPLRQQSEPTADHGE